MLARMLTKTMDLKAPMVVDFQQREGLLSALKAMVGRFEEGAPPPVGACELLTDLAHGLAEASLAEAGLSPRTLQMACACVAAGIDGCQDPEAAVRGRKVESALRHLCELFEGCPHDPEPGPLPSAATQAEPQVPRWLRTALLLVVFAVPGVAVFVDQLPGSEVVRLLLVLVLPGEWSIVHGLTLGPAQRILDPRIAEQGFVRRWVAHHVPPRVASTGWVVGGLVLLALAGSRL